MRITGIEVTHLRAGDAAGGDLFDGSYDDVVVQVHTDEGLVGLGEAESLAPAVRAVIEGPGAHRHARALREVVIGADPTDPEAIWDELYDATNSIGRRGLVMHAIGAVDIALWDLAAQAQGKPVHALLGGAVHDRIPAYGSIYPLARTPDEVRGQVAAARDRNLRAFKLCADPWWLDDLDATAGLLHAARDEAGPDATLIVDAALAYPSADDGLRLLPLFRDIGIRFLEAPLPLDDPDGHARMAGHGVPLGIGDLGLTHLWEFIELTERGAGDVWQPDITNVGGFTALKRIGAEARRRGIPIVPHGYKSAITIAANMHFLATEPYDVLQEYALSASPLRWETTRERLPVEDDGTVLVPQGPGLGVTLDPATVERYAVR
jgi:L-alanine-DL-glutamate epimerase-like enolase superfamily enzyme